ncbi:polysaccharide deacetylase [Stakelama sp. CBK3Z-3]|uniref:Polysaccharide deacetylase n=1 Tax=Stakelama flava TaxID=2860338 RepID=A0ABS6XNN2_9SPHN|nr:polysaccharide deacetylase [Stakelama flava]MBW4331835.1 polysaccharide deacetylase [Stakelama flava]
MATSVFLTVDTEFAWRHHVEGLTPDEIVRRSFQPAGVGIGWQLRRLAAHRLKAVFFVDPMPALVFGLDPFRRIVGEILEAGQRVQLHLHPNWAGARAGDGGASHGGFALSEYDRQAQCDLIGQARELLMAAGAPRPVAFRAGSYAANGSTLDALADLGFLYDSSHNGSDHPDPSAIDLPPRQIAPVAHRGVIEVPVTVIEDLPGRLRHFQICALSAAEMAAALDHAATNDHAVVTIVSHGFELANRDGTQANGIHVGRFESLCGMLEERADIAPTRWFSERPDLTLADPSVEGGDEPLAPSLLRTGLRQVQQLWSNLVEERAA